jgi:hypothetical protein
MDKTGFEREIGFVGFEQSGGALFAFSAKTRSVGTIAFVVKANAKKGTRADSLMREKNFPDRPI